MGMSILKHILIAWLLPLSLLLSASSAAAWQQLGGDPQRSATRAMPIATTPVVQWRQMLPGPAFASALSDGQSLFSVAGQSVQAWSLGTGRLLWQQNLATDLSATPVLIGPWLIVAGKDGVVRALDRRTGNAGWHYQSRDRVVAALLGNGEMVYAGAADNYLYAISAGSGELRWRFEAADYKYGGIHAPATRADNMIYVGAKNAWFHALDAHSGILRWRTHLGSAIYAAPVVADGRIYIGTYDRHLYALRQSDGEILWQTRFPDWPQGSVLLHHGRVHAACRNGELLALNQQDGQILWRIDLGSELRHGPVMGQGGRAVLGTVAGELLILDLNRQQILSRQSVGGAIHAQPILAQGGIVVTTLNGELLRLQ